MFGDDRLFEKLVQAGEEIEDDSNKNVDETIEEIIKGYSISGSYGEQLAALVEELGVSEEEVLQAIVDNYENDLSAGGDMGTLDEWLDDNLGVETVRNGLPDPVVEEPIESKEENTNEEEVKEAQEPLTKQDIQFAIGELQDKLAGEHASSDDLDRWAAELDKLEAELKDAPDEAEFESKTNEEELTSEVECKGCGEPFEAAGEEQYCSNVCRKRAEKTNEEEVKEEEKVKEGVQEDYDAALGSLVALVTEFVGEEIPQEQIEIVLHNLVIGGGAAGLADATRAYGNLRAEQDPHWPGERNRGSEASAERWAEDVHPELSPPSKKRYVADVGEKTDTVSNDPSFERTVEKFSTQLEEAQLKEGQFSWHAGDTDEPIYSTEGHQKTVWMLDDKGNEWQEDEYEGYGVFGGKDFYELLAEMNGLELTGDTDKDRELGIDLAFKDSSSGESEGVKYPRFTTDHKIPYEKLPNPRSHENQGWFEEEGRDEHEDDWDDYDERDDESKVVKDDATEACAGKKHAKKEEVDEEKVQETLEKATDGELKAAMTALGKLHSADVAKTMDTIADEISRRSREYDRQMGENDSIKEEEVDESYGSVYIEADLHRGMSREAVIKKLQTRYPDIGDEEAEKIVTAVEKGEDWPRRE